MKKLHSLGLAYILGWLLLCEAFGQSERDDIRERCRVAVSGQLLLVYNDVDGMKDRITALEQQNLRLRQRRGSLHTELATKRKQIEGQAYDRSLEESVIVLEHQLKQVQAEFEQGESLLQTYRQQFKTAAQRMDELTPLLSKVFERIYPADLQRSKGYRFTLAYRESCSRYQYLCPLSEAGRRDLRRISQAMGTIEDCERYAQLQTLPR